MTILSPRQRSILDFITSFLQQKGYAPSMREVTAGCGISSPSVTFYNLDVLVREGYLRRDRQISRGIGLVKKRKGVLVVPLLGAIAAGEPIPVPSVDAWTTTPELSLRVPWEMTRGLDKIYALRVKGSSMTDAMVDDGDIVLMRQASAAEDGEMVAVWLKQEQAVTLKRIYRGSGRIRLQPANKQMQPLFSDPGNVEIQGIVIGVIRSIEAPQDG